MAMEDMPIEMWGYEIKNGWGMVVGHPPEKIDPVPVRKAIQAMRACIMVKVLDTRLRDELMTQLVEVDRKAQT
jgi:hypothetical protein